MSYPKQKTESYRATGGMNTKASQYITEDTEFLNLQNVDFRTVGALSSFAGSTLYISTGTSSMIAGIQDYGNTVLIGYTVIAGSTVGLYGVSNFIFATDARALNDISSGTFNTIYRYMIAPNEEQTSFTFLDYNFGANRHDFWTFPGGTFGNTVWLYGMPKVNGVSFNPSNSGVTGMITQAEFYLAAVRQDGFVGPAQRFAGAFDTASIGTGVNWIAMTFRTAPNLSLGLGISVGSFGISGVQAWIQINQGPIFGLTGLLAATTGFQGLSIGQNFTATGTWVRPGTNPNAGFPQTEPLDFIGSFAYGLNAQQGAATDPFASPSYNATAHPNPTAPQVIESFFNQLFMAFGSRVFYSDIGTPEQTSYDNFFDVAPDVPEDVTLMTAYFTQLVIAKPGCVYVLSGSGPSTFNLTLVSDEYGCLNKQAAVVWNQTFWFLDKKGIMEFNGANVIPTSNKMEDIFNRMNVDAAARTAVMTHVKDRNEVWCAIPIDGSTVNNIIVVYDYLSNAWTTRTSPPGAISALALVDRGNNKQTVYYGTTTGVVGTFGSSFIGDNGANFTSVIKSRFIAPLGDSTTNLFRRLYIDANVPVGASIPFLINMYADHGATIAYQTTMVLTTFQNRIDFGVPAKSLAIEFIYSGSEFLCFNGFTIESRFQRAV